jgi:integrase
MATIKYLIRGKSNPNTIYLRLLDGRSIDLTVSTGLTIDPDHWDNKKHKVRQRAADKDKLNLDKDLRTLTGLVTDGRNEQVAKALPVNREWLDELIRKWQGKQINGVSDYLIDMMISYKENLPNKVRNGKKGVSAGTIRNYNTTISRLTKYEKALKRRLRIVDVDLNFHKKYIKFASEVLGLAVNSIGNDIRKIKTVCLDARDEEILINEQVLSRGFSAPSEKTMFTTLNEIELDKIRAFEGTNYLENARDWLIIGCWTGCRVSDLMELSLDKVFTHHTGAQIIQYTQRKTGKLVNVPMHHHVIEIVDRLGGFPRPISSVKFNQYIKEVCKKSKLTYQIEGTRQNPETHTKETGKFEKWQLIRSHTCRRSFATNHYNKMTNKQIMAITGHSTEKMLLVYIGETEIEHVDDYMNLWNEKPKHPTLKVQA